MLTSQLLESGQLRMRLLDALLTKTDIFDSPLPLIRLLSSKLSLP